MICAKLFGKLKALPGVWAGEGPQPGVENLWDVVQACGENEVGTRGASRVLSSYELPSLFHRLVTIDP